MDLLEYSGTSERQRLARWTVVSSALRIWCNAARADIGADRETATKVVARRGSEGREVVRWKWSGTARSCAVKSDAKEHKGEEKEGQQRDVLSRKQRQAARAG